MDTNQIRELLNERGDKTALSVLSLLERHPKGLTRERMTRMVYKTFTPSLDRQTRKAIKRLRDLGLVILSSTKRPGYRLAGPREIAVVMAYAEQQVRAAKSRMATARKVLKAYGLKDNARFA